MEACLAQGPPVSPGSSSPSSEKHPLCAKHWAVDSGPPRARGHAGAGRGAGGRHSKEHWGLRREAPLQESGTDLPELLRTLTSGTARKWTDWYLLLRNESPQAQ